MNNFYYVMPVLSTLNISAITNSSILSAEKKLIEISGYPSWNKHNPT